MPLRSNRVLVLGGHFPPEPTGNAPYTGSLAHGMAERGADVRVITTHPSYPEWKIASGYGQWARNETIGDVAVRRLRHYVPRAPTSIRRALSELSFGIRLAISRWGDVDAVILVSPLLLSTWLALARARLTHPHVPTVVWTQDLYSLGLAETGQGNCAVQRIMNRTEGWVLRRASCVVVIHERFAQRVMADFAIAPERVRVIRNWTHLAATPEIDVSDARLDRGWRDDETIVLHAGNMGVKQGLENVVEAARLAADRQDRVRFVFLGDGGQRSRLETLAGGLSNIEFIAPLPDAAFAAAMQAADILLVNEREGVAEMAVPSKLTSYFASGKPVLAATDPGGITADEIRRASAGVVVPAGDPEALLAAAISLAGDYERAKAMGANGRRYRLHELDAQAAIDKFLTLIESLTIEGLGKRSPH